MKTYKSIDFYWYPCPYRLTDARHNYYSLRIANLLTQYQHFKLKQDKIIIRTLRIANFLTQYQLLKLN